MFLCDLLWSHFNLEERGAIIAERRERSEANNRVLFEILRYLYIYIYVCLHVHCTRPCTPYASPIMSAILHLEHWLLFGAPLWGLALLLGMADSASSAEDSPDDDRNWAVRIQLPDTRSAVQATLRHKGKSDAWLRCEACFMHYAYV